MEQILNILGICLFIAGFIAFFVWCIYSVRRDNKHNTERRLKMAVSNTVINQYLDTVIKRANMCNDDYALKLLIDEMIIESEKFCDNHLFSKETHYRWIKIQFFVIGKLKGLRGKNNINEYPI